MKIQRTDANFAAWLSLIRLPNLLTVPGDPVAGFLLASIAGGDATAGDWKAAGAAVGVSLLIYAHGMIQNDLLDFREDRRSRPQRPLPSGMIGLRPARGVCIVLAAAAMVVAGLIGGAGILFALGLTLAVSGYNGLLKNHRLLGPLTMGLCRSLSLLLGAAAAGTGMGSPPVWSAAALLGLYIAAITSLAADETRTVTPGFRRWNPALVCLAGFGLFAWTVARAGSAAWPFALVFGWPFALWAGGVGHRLGGNVPPERIQECVGRWLRGILFLQFVLIAIGWGSMVAPAIIFLVGWFLHRRLSRWFAST